MITHTLSCGRLVFVDKCDEHLLHQHTWRVMLNARRNTTYVQARPSGTRITLLLHRLIYPDAEVVDHIDNNGLNNLRSNLRPCTYEENGWNRGPKMGRRYKGVIRRERTRKRGGVAVVRWEANLEAWGVRYPGGYHDTEEDAARAYDALARKHHGEFGYLNFPDEGAIYDNEAARAVASVELELPACGL